MIAGIYLEDTKTKTLSPDRWSRAYELCHQEILRHSLHPTYYTIATTSEDGKQKKFGTAAHANRLGRGFEGVEFVALTAGPVGSESPINEWFAKISFSCFEVSDHGLTAELLIDEKYCKFGSDDFDQTLKALIEVADWDYGWGNVRGRERDAALYLSGLATSPRMSAEDDRRMDLWYEVYDPEERLPRLRDVFEYNIVNSRQLSHPVGLGNLKEFILAEPNSSFEVLADDLFLWKVWRGKSEEVRRKLLGTGLIISE